ncbi:MAG: hypothetical protein H0U49_08455 [Parachlamydiaceae bacterium]|nr:hypothetical protein [Parachlamydiaceae bacterium]
MNLSAINSLISIDYTPTYPRLTYYPLAFGLAAIATILAVKICDSYNPDALSSLKLKTIKFHQDYPIMPVIALIFFMTVGVFSLSLGIMAAVPFGIYSGWRFEINRATRLQKLHADGNHLQNPNNQLALS